MNAQANLKPQIKLAECDVTVTRVFDAPRDLVFRMWTDAAHFTHWWGPRGYTNPICELDARAGGAIFVRMRAPDGSAVLMHGTFREIVEGKRLVLSAVVAAPGGEAMFEGLVTATFEDEGGRTRLTVREQAVGLVAAAAPILARMENTWTESLRRLAAALSADG
jgi:uncharacterized protein YndB with AHSA1/START domain